MNVKRVPPGKNVDQMLLEGELEAALYPETLPSIRSGNPKVALLFPEPKKAEIEYYKNGGFFPIMHTVVVKNPILAEHPWVGISLVRAFQQAKEICYARNSDPRSFALVWVQDLQSEQRDIFGPILAIQSRRQSQSVGSGNSLRVRAGDDQEKARG